MYVYLYIHIYNNPRPTRRVLKSHRSKINNVPSRLSPQWLCGNSCTCHKAIVVISGRAHLFS